MSSKESVKDFVVDCMIEYYEMEEHWKPSDKEIWGYLIRLPTYEVKEIDEHRWYISERRVVRIRGRYLMFDSARTTGDLYIYDTWEFDSDAIKFCKPVEIKQVTYEVIDDNG